MSVVAHIADASSPAPCAARRAQNRSRHVAERRKGRAWFALLLLGLIMLMPWWAYAQMGPMPTIDQVMQEGQAEAGLAEQIMEGLLGGVFNDPFTLGAPSTLFGVIFFAFNAFVFAVAVAWGTYGIVAGIVQTAHEGQVLGKRLSAIWMPIRTVTGIGSLIPIFGGFSLSQAVMILALGWGIAGANYVSRIGIDALANFVPMTNPTPIQGTPSASARDLSFNLFMQQLCRHGFQRAINESNAMGVAPTPASILSQRNFTEVAQGVNAGANEAVGSAFGTSDDPTACLAVGIIRNEYDAPGVDENPIWGRQMRNYSVQYETIATEAYARYTRAFAVLQQRAFVLADAYAREYDQFLAGGGAAAGAPPIPAAQLMRISAEFTAMDQGEGAQGSGAGAVRAIHQNVLTQVQGLGFLSLGMYHSMISEANTALNAARNAVTYHISGANPIFAPENNLPQSHYVSAALRSADRMGFTGVGAASTRDLNDLLQFDDPSGDSNIGQEILNVALGALVTGNQQWGVANFSLIDPIISAKNVGSYMMAAGSVLVFTPTIVNIAGRAVAGAASIAGRAAAILGAGTPVGKAGAAAAVVGDGAGAILAHATTLGWLLLVVGAALAIYIPFVPFLNWVSAMVQYVSTVIQAFVAAPIWSLAHMDMSGEGMGERAEKGYVWILLVMFKPVLMVIAFFAATGMVILIGSVVTWIYLPVVANVQGNSLTGLFSIIGFIILYFVMLNIIIQGSFNLVEEISDDAIGWLGHAGRSNVGKGMDERMGSVFVAGVRSSRGEVGALAAASGRPGR